MLLPAMVMPAGWSVYDAIGLTPVSSSLVSTNRERYTPKLPPGFVTRTSWFPGANPAATGADSEPSPFIVVVSEVPSTAI